MSHVIEVTDEQYRTLAEAAEARGLTLDTLLASLIEELRDRDREPRYYSTDEWLHHLGVSDERIQRANAKIAREEESASADA